MPKIVERPYGLHYAPEAVSRTLAMINSRQEAVEQGTAIASIFGIPAIDNYVVTFWPGQVIFTIALPSNGKSFIARMHAKHILNTLMDTDDDRVIVWITVEEPVEKVTGHWLAALAGVSSTSLMSGRIDEVEYHKLEAYVSELTTWPIFIIGHSVSRRNENDERVQGARLTRNQIQSCLEYIMNTLKKDIAFVVLDYIQRVHPEDYEKNEPHMRATVDWTRDLALMCACPIEVCSQAKNEVADRKFPLPLMTDGQWTSSIGQTGDTIFGAWMPKTSHGTGAHIDKFAGFNDMEIREGHMFIRVAKQRDGQAGGIFLVEARPDLLTWNSIERISLDDAARNIDNLRYDASQDTLYKKEQEPIKF